jgi:hypothetical protein
VVKSEDDGEKIKEGGRKGLADLRFENYRDSPRTRTEEKLFQLVSRPCRNRRQIQNLTTHITRTGNVCTSEKQDKLENFVITI